MAFLLFDETIAASATLFLERQEHFVLSTESEEIILSHHFFLCDAQDIVTLFLMNDFI